MCFSFRKHHQQRSLHAHTQAGGKWALDLDPRAIFKWHIISFQPECEYRRKNPSSRTHCREIPQQHKDPQISRSSRENHKKRSLRLRSRVSWWKWLFNCVFPSPSTPFEGEQSACDEIRFSGVQACEKTVSRSQSIHGKAICHMKNSMCICWLRFFAAGRQAFRKWVNNNLNFPHCQNTQPSSECRAYVRVANVWIFIVIEKRSARI